jgi:WD40 repeat protein
MIRRWDTNTGKEIEPASGHTAIVGWLRFTPDSKTLFSSGNDRRVLEWDLATGRAHQQLFGGPLGPADEA